MPVYNPPKLREMYNVTLNNFSTITPLTIPTAGFVGASDGVGGIRFVAQSGGGGSVSSNYAFSNLRVADTLSTSSTFTDFISSAQIITSSIIAQSALIVGSNTLTVFGQTFLSSVTLTGQFLISTIPGQPAQPLDAALISSLNVITSTLTYNDDIKIQSLTNTTSRIALGYLAGEATQGAHSIAIGDSAGYENQSTNAIAIGHYAGEATQGAHSIAIGDSAGYENQSTNAIAIGTSAGLIAQGENAIAIGPNAGASTQSTNAIAIGKSAGFIAQGENAIAIGFNAGATTQSTNAIAIGQYAGQIAQGENAIAIGFFAGLDNQSTNAIAIGLNAGATAQGENTVAIGLYAGLNNQSINAIAIGQYAGGTAQGEKAIAIGLNAGLNNQSTNAIAIGQNAGQTAQGENAIAIGFLAGYDNQSTNTIVLNATGNILDTTSDNSLFIAPVRSDNSPANVLFYNTTTKEVTYGAGGGGGSVSSNLGLSNLNIIDTLSTTSTFSVEISTGQLKVSTILFDDGNTEYNLYSQGGQLYYNNALIGGSIPPNYAFSTLRIADTLSTTSTFTDFISTNAMIADYISTYSMTVFGPNTLTVQGNTVLSTIIVSGQISTVGTAPFATDLTLESLTLQDPATQLTQTMYTSSVSVVQSFAYTGADQTFIVPAGVTNVHAVLYGAGGVSAEGDTGGAGYGGNGARIEGDFSVTPSESITLIVGQGGQFTTQAYGGGGKGGGGGRSEIRRGTTAIATAGAGGGGGYFGGNGGSAGTSTYIGEAATQAGGVIGGQGDTAGATGGASGGGDAQSGLGPPTSSGGDSSTDYTSGGGGGGYYGGGGAFTSGGDTAGGGGGSSYVGGFSVTTLEIAGITADSTQYSSYPEHTGAVAYGNEQFSPAGNGLIVLSYEIPAIFSDRQFISSLTNEYISSFSGVMGPLDVSDPSKFKITTLNPYTPGQSNLYYDDASKEVYYGPGIPADYAFSNLRIADTLSTMSTYTEFLSAPQILTSSITFTNAVQLSGLYGNVAIGPNAGVATQGVNSIAIGAEAGSNAQKGTAVAIGSSAGRDIQGENSIAIGNSAGYNTQLDGAIGIGALAGELFQKEYAIAIGFQAGQATQRPYSIAIGYQAGQNNQAPSTIILNASGAEVSGVLGQGGSFYVSPIRPDTTANLSTLTYNPGTKEITYSPLRFESGTYTGNWLNGLPDPTSTISFSSPFPTSVVVVANVVNSEPSKQYTVNVFGLSASSFTPRQFYSDVSSSWNYGDCNITWIAYGS